MLVRLGAADSVPEGRRIVRAQPAQRVRALPSVSSQQQPEAAEPEPEPEPEPHRLYQPAYLHDGQAKPRAAQRACEAYRAAELIQPRPGLFLRVKA